MSFGEFMKNVAQAGLPRFNKDALGNFRGLFTGNKNIFLPYTLAQSAVPVILVPSGTVAANGAINLVTPLPMAYTSGAWIRLPAGAIVGDPTGGLYWAVFSTTTAGSVKTNFVDTSQPFLPYVPTGPLTAATGSGSAYTQTTNAYITLVNVTVPGGAIGPNGQLLDSREISYNTAAGSKMFSVNFGGIGILGSNRTTNGGHDHFTSRIKNRGVQNANSVYAASEGATASAIPYSMLAVNTAVDQTYALMVNIDTATNYAIIEALTLQVLPS